MGCMWPWVLTLTRVLLLAGFLLLVGFPLLVGRIIYMLRGSVGVSAREQFLRKKTPPRLPTLQLSMRSPVNLRCQPKEHIVS